LSSEKIAGAVLPGLSAFGYRKRTGSLTAEAVISGVFITLPVTAPIRTGHLVELNFPRTETLAKEKGQFARIKTGKIVRVDRKKLLENAEIGVGIAFEYN